MYPHRSRSVISTKGIERSTVRAQEMSSIRTYIALNFFIALLRDGSGFLHSSLQPKHASALQRAGRSRGRTWAQTSELGSSGALLTRSQLARRAARGAGIAMMAKKRRRRRVDEASSEGSTSSQTLTERESPSPQQVEESTGISAVVGQAAEVEEEEDEEEEEEQEQESGIRGVVMPPLPSELGMNAVKTAQDLAGEDMLSAAAYQPRMEVTDVEMMGGLTDKASLIDDPRAKKKSKYSFDLPVELPVESEVRQKGKPGLSLEKGQTPDGMMPLPDLKDLAKKPRKKAREKERKKVDESRKVARGNVAAFTSLLELDPEADSDEGLFTSESYDTFSSILGEGKPFVGIANSYLQSGHTVLLGLLLLCAFAEIQGFPLTELPNEVRESLKTGLLVIYVINAGMAGLSFLEARRVGQPAVFWAFKGFVLGGLAYNELSQIEPTEVTSSKGARRRG